MDQFRAFQDLMQQGEFNAAATTAEALLRERLTPVQRALVLQLQGDVQQRLNNREAAERCWRASLDLRFTPELALRLQDPTGLAELPARGHRRELARTMANTLQRYPLQQQQRALLTDLEQEPRLAALVHQLRRLMPER